MPKRIATIFLLMILMLDAIAQEKLNYAEVDRRSYQLFQENKWPELIQFAAEAREQGIDFFYLQVRTGIAWYNQGKYRNAAQWFLKAYKNDNSFEWLQEYLYYSLVFSGRSTEAAKYAPRFPDAVKKKIGFRETGISRLAYETGYSFNPDFASLETRDFKTEVNLGEDYGEGYFLKNYSFHSIDISHRVAANFTLNHNLTYIGVNREAVVDWSEKTKASIRINQFNYYINPVWLIGNKLNISPSLNLILGSGDVYAGYINRNLSRSYQLTKTNYTDAVVSTALWSDFSNFSPGLEFNAAKINDSKFAQMSAWVTYYPLSNARLYFTPRVYFKSGNESVGWNAAGISGGATLGKINIYGNYLWGQMENFIESAGYVIANFPGRSDRKMMASVFFPINRKYQFVIRYMNQHVIEKYQVYTNGFKTNSLEYNYLKNTLTAGISWNF